MGLGDSREYKLKLDDNQVLNELDRLYQIIDEVDGVTGIINIKNRLSNLDTGKHNAIITEKIDRVRAKFQVAEENFKYYNGKRYATVKEVEDIKEEIYYIESEAYKFDLLDVEGMKLFLELMSLRAFKSNEARELVDKYKEQFFKLKSTEVAKVEINEGKVAKLKHKKRVKMIMWSPATAFTGLMASIMVSVIFEIPKLIIVMGIAFGFSVIASLCSILYYYLTGMYKE